MNGAVLLALAILALYVAGRRFDVGFTRAEVARAAVLAVPVALVAWLGLTLLFAFQGWPR